MCWQRASRRFTRGIWRRCTCMGCPTRSVRVVSWRGHATTGQTSSGSCRVSAHLERLRDLMKDVLHVVIRAKLIKTKHTAVDGTKVEADAGKGSVHREETIAEKLAGLDEQIAALEAEWTLACIAVNLGILLRSWQEVRAVPQKGRRRWVCAMIVPCPVPPQPSPDPQWADPTRSTPRGKTSTRQPSPAYMASYSSKVFRQPVTVGPLMGPPEVSGSGCLQQQSCGLAGVWLG